MTPVLVDEIEAELSNMQVAVVTTARLLEKVQQTGDEDYLGSIALNLQSFYTGVERLFITVAKTVDEIVPTGDSWHQQLINQMAIALPAVRQPVISARTQTALDEFRRFRHVVRSHYAYQLDPDRVKDLAEKLFKVSSWFVQDCEQFCQSLGQADQPS